MWQENIDFKFEVCVFQIFIISFEATEAIHIVTPITQIKLRILTFFLQRCAHFYMRTYSVAANANFKAETCFKKYWKLTEKSTKKRWKITTKKKIEFEKKKLRRNFLNWIFSIRKRTYCKNAISKILYIFRDLDKK